MTTITAVTASDVRFPTSLSMDGSDAMNKDGDYSAAYVMLTHRRSRPLRVRLHVHDRAGQRPVRRGRPAAGAAADRPRRRRAGRRSRRGLPRAAERHAAALAGSGEGRRAPRARRRDERGLGSRRPPRRQAAVAAARRHDARSSSSMPPTCATSPTRITRDEAIALLTELEPTRATRIAELEAERLPLLHDERRMARLLRRQAAAALPGGGRLRLPAHQAQGRREHRRRHPAARHRARGHRMGRQPDDRRQPGLGRARGDRVGVAARRVQAALDRGADQPRRRARSRGGPRRRRADRRRHRRARHEPRAVQADVPGRGDRLLPARRGAAGERERDPRRSTSWRGSSASRSARTPAASACASSCSTCRSSTTSRSREPSRTGSPSSSTTCTSTSSIRASSPTAPTCCPSAPGYSAEMYGASVTEYSFPDGGYWGRARSSSAAPAAMAEPGGR